MKVLIEKTSKQIKAGMVLSWLVALAGLLVALSGNVAAGVGLALAGVLGNVFFRIKRWWDHG